MSDVPEPETELPEQEFAQFVINVEHDHKEGTSKVSIEHEEGCPFNLWIAACEYLLFRVARGSNAGFERALELLCQGAMSYKEEIKET